MPKRKERDGKRAQQGARKKARTGLPSPSTVVGEGTLTSPKGRHYRVIRTTEKDPYDEGNSDGKKR